MWYSQRLSTLYHMKRGQLSPSWGGYYPRMPCYLLCSQVESISSSTQNPIIRKRHVWSTLAQRNSPGFSAGHFQSIDNWLEATRRDDSTHVADRRILPKGRVSPYTNPCHEKGKIVKLLTNTSQTNDFQMTTGSTLSDCLTKWGWPTMSWNLDRPFNGILLMC